MALSRKGLTSLDALGVNVRLEYGDIQDREYVERVVNASEADVVFHLAAVSIVRIAEHNPGRAYRTNILGTVNVAEACQDKAKLLIASSDKAYGDAGGAAYREDQPLQPNQPYEISKAASDMIGRSYGAVVLRCANLFGPGDLN
jgi:CDP-glucose 4,6-dehydratase